MGRLRRGTRRGVRRRALALLVILLIGPAAVFSWLGWQSLDREHAVRATELRHEAARVLDRRVRDWMDRIGRIEKREAARAYYAYQDVHLALGVDQGFLFQRSPLTPPPDEPLLQGWFQWESFPHYGAARTPEVFPEDAHGLAERLRVGYGADLVLRLERAASEVADEDRGVRTRMLPLRVIAANEERGQLSEELRLHQRDSRAMQQAALPGSQADPVERAPYIVSFEERTQGEREVAVRVGSFRYLAAPAGFDGPEFVAYRLVSIASTHARSREVRHTRWLMQGYTLDLDQALPSTWQQDGTTQIASAAGEPEAQGVMRRSLLSALDADTAVLSGGEGRTEGLAEGPGTGSDDPAGTAGAPALPQRNEALILLARADPQAIERDRAKRSRQFFFLLAGLAGLVITGCYVLFRMIRSELHLVRRKEDFMAAITHELKTPLTGIRMYAEMLREGWTENRGAAERYADRIIDESQRLGHLVGQVLDLTALERGVSAMRAVPGDLGEAVRRAVALMGAKAESHGVEMTVQVAEDVPEFPFDPRLVDPLVLNLIDNAIKYGSKSEAPRVEVRVQRSGERVLLQVSDNGPGIDASVRKHLFEPFRRADGELTRDTPGVGIGLALVKRYAEAHRARVTVDSEPGRGTRVRVRFPVGRTI